MKKLLLFTTMFVGLMCGVCFGAEPNLDDYENLAAEVMSTEIGVSGFDCKTNDPEYALMLIMYNISIYSDYGTVIEGKSYHMIDEKIGDIIIKDKYNITPTHKGKYFYNGASAVLNEKGYYFVRRQCDTLNKFYGNDLEVQYSNDDSFNIYKYFENLDIKERRFADGREYITLFDSSAGESLKYILAEFKEEENTYLSGRNINFSCKNGYWSYYYVGDEPLAEAELEGASEETIIDIYGHFADAFDGEEATGFQVLKRGDDFLMMNAEALEALGIGYKEEFANYYHYAADLIYASISEFIEKYGGSYEFDEENNRLVFNIPNKENREKIKTLRAEVTEAKKTGHKTYEDEEHVGEYPSESGSPYHIYVMINDYNQSDFDRFNVYTKNNKVFCIDEVNRDNIKWEYFFENGRLLECGKTFSEEERNEVMAYIKDVKSQTKAKFTF